MAFVLQLEPLFQSSVFRVQSTDNVCGAATRQQLNSELCYLHSVLCTLYSVLCTLYSVLCTLHSALCTLFCFLGFTDFLNGSWIRDPQETSDNMFFLKSFQEEIKTHRPFAVEKPSHKLSQWFNSSNLQNKTFLTFHPFVCFPRLFCASHNKKEWIANICDTLR